MLTTTWELHYAAPRPFANQESLDEGLNKIKESYTLLRMDWDRDENGLHIMFGDPEVLMDVVMLMGQPTKLTCQFVEATYDGTVNGTLVLDDDEDENSEIYFPTKDGSE